MSKTKIKIDSPLFVGAAPARLIKQFPNGNLVVAMAGDNRAYNYDKYGYGIDHPARLRNGVITRVEYYAFYPQTGMTYKGDKPIKSSSYGLDQVVQFKLTFQDNVLVRKEFV